MSSTVEDHYSLVREREYAVVKEVKKGQGKIRERDYAVVGEVKRKPYDPYSKVKDEDDDSSQTGSNYYSQVSNNIFNRKQLKK